MNADLCYLLSGLHVDGQGILVADRRAPLDGAICTMLQKYADENSEDFFSSGTKRAFTNKSTYENEQLDATVCTWSECFDSAELQKIKDFCTKKDLVIN